MSNVYTVNANVAIVDKDGKPTVPIIQAFNQLTKLLGGNGYIPVEFSYVPPGGAPFGALYLNADGFIVSTGAMDDGQILIGATGSVPSLGNITGTANQVSVSNGPGSITLSAPQNIDSTSSPTFAGLTLTSLTGQGFVFVGAADIVSSTAAATDGQLLIGSTGNNPVAATLAGTANQLTVTNAPGSITLSLPQDIATTSNVTFNQLTLTNGFGCNGASPQVEAVVNAAVAGTAGAAYTATEQTIINNLVALVNQLRAALVANGIAI